jgi:excisionase family DNA binding protein
MLIAEVLRERHSAITVPELANILSVSPRQLYKLAGTNRIPNFRIGTSVRFDPDAIRQWLQEKEPIPRRRPPTSQKFQDTRASRVA